MSKLTNKEKIKLAQKEASMYRGNLASQGINFDAQGNVTNYVAAMKGKQDYLNSLISKYNSMSETEQKNFKSTVEQAKKDYEQFKKDMEYYENLVSETIPENCPVGAEKIRPVTKIIDTEPLFTEEIFELAQWISKYYLCSIGEAVFSIIPSRGKRESSAAGFSFDSELSEKSSNTLSDEQEEAVKAITLSAQSGKAAYHYLYGPTGTGKTETAKIIANFVFNDKRKLLGQYKRRKSCEEVYLI